jgi:hypothetical protein
VAGCCERFNEPSGSIKSTEFVEQVSDYKLLKDAPNLLPEYRMQSSIHNVVLQISEFHSFAVLKNQEG